MNNIYKVLLLLPVLFFISCIREENVVSSNEDINLSVKLSIDDFDEVQTKVSSSYETKIQNVGMLMFDLSNGGRVIARGYFDENAYRNFSDWVREGRNNSESERKLSAIQGRRVAVFAIANYRNITPNRDAGDNDPHYISNITLEDITTNIRNISDLRSKFIENRLPLDFNRDEAFLRVGYTEYVIQDQQQRQQIDLHLKRVDAKISFKIQGRRDLNFIPLRWRICNIPTKVNILGPSSPNDDSSLGAEYKKDTPWRNFEEAIPMDNTSDYNNPGSPNFFTVYIPQNRLPAQKNITPTEYSLVTGQRAPADYDSNPRYAYALRAHREKTNRHYENVNWPVVTNGNFDYAPVNATYIEVEGSISQNNADNTKREANVRYTIPLGYVGRDRVAKENDYFVSGNTHYNIWTRVTGVNDIYSEVTTNYDRQNIYEYNSGAEGSIYDARFEEIDAHFSTRIIKVKLRDLLLKPASPAEYFVDTPYDKDGHRDNKWIRFVLLPASKPNELPENFEQIAFAGNLDSSNNGVALNGYMFPPQFVNLITEMKKESWWNANNRRQKLLSLSSNGEPEVSFAVHIYEYFYDSIPRDDNGNALISGYTEESFKRYGYRTFVNGANRVFKLFITDYPKYSADKKSTYSRPDIVLSQRPIQTTVPLSLMSLEHSYEGFETIDEVVLNDASDHNKPNYVWTGSNDIRAGNYNINVNPYSTVNASNVFGGNDPNWQYSTLRIKGESFGYRATLAWAGLLNIDNHLGGVGDSPDWSSRRKIYKDKYYGVRDGSDKSSVYQCLARNSDVNGNGKIDVEEIRWYIPAYRQLMRIVIADHAINQKYRLINSSFADNNPYFLISTTDGNPDKSKEQAHHWVLWAKEGYTRSYAQDDAINKISVRCVRNLTNPPENPNHGSLYEYEWQHHEEPIKVRVLPDTRAREMVTDAYSDVLTSNKYYDSNKSSWEFTDPAYPNGEYDTRIDYSNIGLVIDLRNMDPRFLRTKYLASGEIPPMGSSSSPVYPTMDSPYEQPYYKGFRVAVTNLGKYDQYNGMYWASYDMWYSHNSNYYRGPYRHTLSGGAGYHGVGNKVNCGNYTERNADGSIETGWRMPSTTELAIMSNYILWGTAQVTVSNRRGWEQAGYEQGDGNLSGLGYPSVLVTWIAPVVAGTLPSGFITSYRPDDPIEPDMVNIFVDTGKNGFSRMTRARPSQSYYHTFQIRCVKDWDPARGGKIPIGG